MTSQVVILSTCDSFKVIPLTRGYFRLTIYGSRFEIFVGLRLSDNDNKMDTLFCSPNQSHFNCFPYHGPCQEGNFWQANKRGWFGWVDKNVG